MKWLLAIAAIWLVWRFMRPAPRPRLTAVQRAARTLGIPADADEGTIRTAHRRLLADAHPDRGGSGEAMTELNAARDLLLGRLHRG